MTPLICALKEYNVSSIPGVGNNPRVLKYFADIGHSWVKEDDTAWCACFANWVLKQCGYEGTGSLLARSFLKLGQPTTTPLVGDIVVLWRISPASGYGHVGFFIKETETTVFILGGNQTERVNIQEFPKTRLLGYRKLYA